MYYVRRPGLDMGRHYQLAASLEKLGGKRIMGSHREKWDLFHSCMGCHLLAFGPQDYTCSSLTGTQAFGLELRLTTLASARSTEALGLA